MGKKKEKRSFKYRERSKDDIRQRANQSSGNFDSILKDKFKTYKPRDGKNMIRILQPTWEDARHYGLDIYVNYGIGVDKQNYLSLSKMKGEADPLAEAKREAEADGDKKLSDALSAKKRVLVWVIDRYAEDEGPQLWAMPWTVDKDLANLCTDEDSGELLMIDHPETGNDIRFFKEGTGRNTKYPAAKMRVMKKSPLSDDEELFDEWLAFIEENPLPDTLNFYDYDHIALVFSGVARTDEDKDKDDDEDERPRRGKDKASSKRRSRDDDEDEDERPKRRKRPADEDDDDDDDSDKSDEQDDDDDEDEDEKPSRSRRSRSRDDDDDDEPKRGKGSRKRQKDDDEDDDETDEEDDEEDADSDDDDEDEEDEKASKKGKSSVKDRLKKLRSRRRSDDD